MKEITKELSIVIITMNRKEQLKEALQSCCECQLPNESEIIIIDNGSTDGTYEMIVGFFENVYIPYKFIKLEENIGIAEGRNIGLRTAVGKYVYNMDDDSIICPKHKDDFFILSINQMKHNEHYATLTTRVYDECLGRWRESKKGKNYSSDNPLVFAFHGNTYFIRNDIEGLEYVPTIRYGYEDVYASILVLDKGYINALYSEVNTIHKPLVNKWIKGSESYTDVLIKGTAGIMTAKYLLYPRIYIPALYIGFFLRWVKYLRNDKGSLRKSYDLFRNQTNGMTVKKIKHRTVMKILCEFGLTSTV